ncbi:peptidoglycan-binding domain-containing protein [Streptomyces venezuelae]|uniref:peptidoglycan-binding domain-containing protein n=1 Tax=Streptomyces venezuelae TaxID=54571 RepID=UPI003425CB33
MNNTYADYGDRGNKVKEIQAILQYRGYNIGRHGVDGSFGGDTLKAVKTFLEPRRRRQGRSQDLGTPAGLRPHRANTALEQRHRSGAVRSYGHTMGPCRSARKPHLHIMGTNAARAGSSWRPPPPCSRCSPIPPGSTCCGCWPGERRT